jgi:L,D-transpeptidase catalytic domain
MISALIVGSLIITDRESAARIRAEPKLRQYCRAVGVTFPPKQLLLRAFKDEKMIEVWAGASSKATLKLIKKYPILAASGTAGPKRQRGDMQVPEGWYTVNRFNPSSLFHLSLGINYPNRSDLTRAINNDPGDDIFIHGNRVSAGCMAMGDPAIEEIFTLARLAKNRISVLILPSRLRPTDLDHSTLYGQLYAINRSFMVSHKMPSVSIDGNGNYRVKESIALAGRGERRSRQG